MRKQLFIAECMRKGGFAYVPFEAEQPDTSAATEKELAARRGFSIFAGLASPRDPVANLGLVYDKDPNVKLIRALSPTQRLAWDQTEASCYIATIRRLTGKTVEGVTDYYTRFGAELRAALRERDTDPYLIRLAKAYSECLSAQQIRHASSKPTEIMTAASEPFYDELHALNGNQTTPDGESLAPEAAMPYFEREVHAALIDADCGRNFRSVYRPRSAEIRAPIAAAWALS